MAKEVRIVMEVNGEQSNVVTPVSESVITEALGFIPVDSSKIGSGSGLAELDENGLVPTSQLPSYIDDVLNGYLHESEFYEDQEHTILLEKESGKIYIDNETNKTYRWSGTNYIVISETLALGETSSTAYRGDRGKIAYDHSQSNHAPVDAEKNQNAFSNIVVGDKYITSNTTSDNINISSGENVNIDIDNNTRKVIINATDTTYEDVTEETSGLMNPEDYKKLNNIEDGANKYVLPTAGTELGGVKTGGNVTIEDGIINVNDNSHLHSIENVEGLQTALDSKSPSTHTHKYAGSSSVGGSATSAIKLTTDAGASNKPVYFSNGTPVACTYELNKSVPSDAVFTDTTYDDVTEETSGLMNPEDYNKLNNIEDGANKYVLPTAGTELGGVKTTSTVTSTSGLTATPIIDGVPYYKNTDTDTKVIQTLKSDNAQYPLLLTPAGQTATTTTTACFDSGVTLNPSSNTISANISGIADKATNDENGENIANNIASLKEQDITNLDIAKSYTNEKISELINSAPTTLDTLGEIATAMSEHENVVEALNDAIGKKANETDLSSHTTNKSNPHGVTKSQIGLGNVENKSSETIRGELTKTNVTDALGYTPPTNDTTYSAGTGISFDGTSINHSNSVTAGTASGSSSKTLTFGGTFTIPKISYDAQGHVTSKGTTTMTMPANPNRDTHYTSKNIVNNSDSATSDTTSALTNGNVYINHIENGVVTSNHKITGSGATTVTTDTSGNIVIKSTDTNTTYSNFVKSGSGAKAGLVPAPSTTAGTTKYLREDGTWVVPPNTNTDTKNTAGSTNSSSKLFLIGATSQAANPQTYSHDTAYVGTDGCLYSNKIKVSTEGHTHSYLPLSGGTMNNDASIKMVYGKDGRYTDYKYNIKMVAPNSGWANGITFYGNDGTSVIGSFGAYGNAATLNYHYIGGTFDDPLFTLDAEGNANFNGSVTATTFSGSGASLTSLNASNVSSGTLAAARLATSGVTAGSYGPSANASPVHSGTFSVPYITVDNKGRVTAASSKTITLPASGNTDTKVTQTYSSSSTSGNYPLLLRATNSITGTSSTTTTSRFCNSFYATPSTGIIHATSFSSIGTNLVTSGVARFSAWTDVYTPTAVDIALTTIDNYSSLVFCIQMEANGSDTNAVLPINYLLASTNNSIYIPIPMEQDVVDSTDTWIGVYNTIFRMRVRAYTGVGLKIYWPTSMGKCVDPLGSYNFSYSIFKI